MIKLEARVWPLEDSEGSTKAFASVTVDDLIAIRGIRVIDGEKGLFVAMPQSKDREGNYHDIAFPVSGDLRKAMNKAVLDEYKEMVKEAAPAKTANTKTPQRASRARDDDIAL